jgi:hypothetical protein
MWVVVVLGVHWSIATSMGGMNWTVADPGGLYRGYGVAWNNPYRGMMNIEQPTIVLGDGSYNTMAYSPDGIRWTGNAGGLGKLMFDGSGSRAAWNGSLWVAVGDPSGNGSPIAYSRDGIAWTKADASGGLAVGRDVAWNGHKWIAVGEGTNSAVHSLDGKNWNTFTTDSLDSAYGIAANDKAWLMVGKTVDASGVIIHSDATNVNFMEVHEWQGGHATSVVWGGKWIVSSMPSDPSGYSLQYAEDPEVTADWTWITDTSLNGVTVNDVEWNGDYFVAVGDVSNNTTIIHSRDGISWSDASNNPFDSHAYGITWNDRRWIAVGDVSNNQCVAYSTDVSGHEWHLAIDSSGIMTKAYGVASNSKAGGIVVPSALMLNKGDKLTVHCPKAYDMAGDTAINFKLYGAD